ncbi:hypothetical protein AZC_1929 [Azorhizobium caulinodans ORS 571]|uniref:Uncharacterized protein n=1 Tax=Azorhizobium caulinodans (strain ATCC 43989 / DSM 5975 / JCM 20966 / LMG 6465 / NBRC 14845 / NCIMB 13405 / ORS 571) TaxID=438753 RepID=A8I2S9_AZOC5|nr:hypothetical protein [Azorhizobium caulinodans]BAF87927.1 hypothetical protein AZC_1929 [Azorhizobium caulinodans ORS 571]
MSRKPAKLATTTHVALFTTTEPFGAAIATGVDAETAYALAHSFACVAVVLDDRLPEGMLGRLKSVALSADAEALSLPEIEVDVIEALTELAVQQGHIKRPPETAVGGDQAGAASDLAESENAAGATREAKETASAALEADGTAILSDAAAGDLWARIAVGHVVLAPDYDDGAFCGFWLAQVRAMRGDVLTLEWTGEYADQPSFECHLSALGLMHPGCGVQQ